MPISEFRPKARVCPCVCAYMPAALLMQSAEHPTVYEPCVGVARHNRLKNIGCDVCRKQFRNDHGLKIHEASASHRAKQLAADTPAQQIQRNDTITLEAQPAQGQRHSVTLDIQPDQGDRHLDGSLRLCESWQLCRCMSALLYIRKRCLVTACQPIFMPFCTQTLNSCSRNCLIAHR